MPEMRFVLFVVLAASIAAVSASSYKCWSSGNGQPARWWEQGERIDRVSGRYWYECSAGQLEPRGCFSDSQQRLSVGESYVADEYVVTCEIGPDGYLKFRQTACVGPDGRHHPAGEQWTDSTNSYYYECLAEGNYLRAQIAGCVGHDHSSNVPIGEKVDFGEYTYQCNRKYNGSVQMCSVGCIHEGKHISIGEQFPDGDYIFYCTQKGGRCRKICVGCQYREKRLYDGDRYQKDKTVYQCLVRRDTYGHKPVGCVSTDSDGTNIERVIGCRWYQHGRDSKVEQTCVLEGDKARIETAGCIYRYKGYDTIWLFPGSYTIWNRPSGDSIGLACKSTSDGGAELVQFPADSVAMHSAGLKYDMPRGK